MAAALACGTTPAAAQINPFGRGPNQPRLTAEDQRMLFDSARRLNAMSPATPGATQTWSNPQSGDSGVTTLRRIFKQNGMTCHAVRYSFTLQGGVRAADYDVNWCRVPDGSWKIAS
jgi:surface antigen